MASNSRSCQKMFSSTRPCPKSSLLSGRATQFGFHQRIFAIKIVSIKYLGQHATLLQSMSRINHSHKLKPVRYICQKTCKKIENFLHVVLFFSSDGRGTRRRAKSDIEKLEATCSKHLHLDNLLASFPIRANLGSIPLLQAFTRDGIDPKLERFPKRTQISTDS